MPTLNWVIENPPMLSGILTQPSRSKLLANRRKRPLNKGGRQLSYIYIHLYYRSNKCKKYCRTPFSFTKFTTNLIQNKISNKTTGFLKPSLTPQKNPGFGLCYGLTTLLAQECSYNSTKFTISAQFDPM